MAGTQSKSEVRDRRSVCRDYQKLYDAAVAQGWHIYHTGSGHLKWVNRLGKAVFTPQSPACRGNDLRVVRKLKQNGLNIDYRQARS